MSDKTTIKFEKTKTIIAKEMGYDDWETCINDQPNYMVEQVMDKVVELYAEQHLEDVLVDFAEYLQYHGKFWTLKKQVKEFLKQRKG